MTTPAQANEFRAHVAADEDIASAIKDADWPRATSLSQAALLDPTLPLFFRALYECCLASFLGCACHVRYHCDKCVEAIDAMRENADVDPENSKGADERIADLCEGLMVVEELMAKEEAQDQGDGDGESVGQDATVA